MITMALRTTILLGRLARATPSGTLGVAIALGGPLRGVGGARARGETGADDGLAAIADFVGAIGMHYRKDL